MSTKRESLKQMFIIGKSQNALQQIILLVDVVYTTHSRDNISRTMDLRNPSAHKMVLINQRYEPWPDMQRVLDRMKFAEKRALKRADSTHSTA